MRLNQRAAVPDTNGVTNLVRDINVLENVQKAATNLVPKLRKYSYPVRLQKLGITTLKDRRERGDMIEVYKLSTGRE